MLLRLPRNLPFIKKLPKKFSLKVIHERNKISEGIWYLVEINHHQLNLLSQNKLREGEILEIKKQGATLLKIIRSLGQRDLTVEPNPTSLDNNQLIDISG